MCGRYSLYSKEIITKKFDINIIPNYNISPGTKVVVIDANISIKKVTWGINFPWLKNRMLINARLESIISSSFYNNYRRCIFIADGYFEWKINKEFKTPYYHYLNDKLIYMAGLYDNYNALIITIQNSNKINPIHNRQPLIVKENYLVNWLKKGKIVSINYDNIHNHIISNKINNTKNNKKSLLNKIN